jgi:hypothetical protein
MIKGQAAQDYQYWASRLLIYLRKSFPETSRIYRDAKFLIDKSHRNGGIFTQDVGMLIGHLKAILDALKDGEIKQYEEIIIAGELSNFLEYSKVFIADGKKMESAVIVSAVFEDIVRRVASNSGIDRSMKLDTIISSFVRKGIISKLESKKLRVYADIRNSALHASWDEFKMSDIRDMIDGTDEFIENRMPSINP